MIKHVWNSISRPSLFFNLLRYKACEVEKGKIDYEYRRSAFHNIKPSQAMYAVLQEISDWSPIVAVCCG